MNEKELKPVPDEIKKFNWGALLFNVVWGVRHGVWISVLPIALPYLAYLPFILGFSRSVEVLVTFLSFFATGSIFVIPILLGFYGNEWAWQKNEYSSVAEFLATQRRWLRTGAIIFVILILSFFYLFNYSDPIHITVDSLNKDEEVVTYLGEQIHKDNYLGNVEYNMDSGSTYIKTNFEVRGTKKAGNVYFACKKTGDQIIVTKIILTSDDDASVIYELNPSKDKIERDKLYTNDFSKSY